MANFQGLGIAEGIASGLEKATNTLLQLQLAKQQMAREDKRLDIMDKYTSARADYVDMQMETLAPKVFAGKQLLSEYQKSQQGANETPTTPTDTTGQQQQAGMMASASNGGVAAGIGTQPQPQKQSFSDYAISKGQGKLIGVNTPSSATATPQVDIVDAVKGAAEGTIPPMKLAAFRDLTRVNAEAKRQGVNLSQLGLEWDATQEFVKQRNTTRVNQFRSSLNSVTQAVDELGNLNKEFQRFNIGPLNKAVLTSLLNGIANPALSPQEQKEAIQLATRFKQQAIIIQDEMGNVIMTGNSPTDQALALSGKILSTNWGQEQLAAGLDQMKKNLAFRKNAFNSLQPLGVGGKEGTRYYGKSEEGQDQSNDYQKYLQAIGQ